MDTPGLERDCSAMKRVVALVTTLTALLAAGCGGAGEVEVVAPSGDEAPQAVALRAPAEAAPRSAAPAAPRVPAGFRGRRLPEAGLELAVPRGWIALGRRDAVWPGTARTLTRIDRGVAGAIAALGMPDSPLKLLALVPAGSKADRFHGTVSLAVTPVASAPRAFGDWAHRATQAMLAGAQPAGRVETRRVRLPVGDAVRLAYERTRGGARLATVQLAALAGDRMVLLVLTSTPERIGALERRFDVLARSIVRVGDTPPAQARSGAGAGLSEVG
jgi:hypothetical protein